MEEPIKQIAARFELSGEPLYAGRYGSGHINQTWLVLDARGREYILQMVNETVFRNVPALMENIGSVTAHLAAKGANYRERMTLVPAKRDGALWLRDDGGNPWRMYAFISDSLSLDRIESPGLFAESARAFGRFQQMLADFPAATLHETIPAFHHTPARYAQLREAIKADAAGRAKEVGPEIAFALAREGDADWLTSRQADGTLPLRVTHNDTKLNNVLFDRITQKALCVIDLDTVMPGLAACDFGDSIRFGASTAAEDERDLDKVRFSLPLYNAYTRGYLEVAGDSLTPAERGSLPWGALLMTLECGVRFLADHLNGDVYFHIARPGQNLDRCRTQFKLVAEMRRQWDGMERVIHEDHPAANTAQNTR